MIDHAIRKPTTLKTNTTTFHRSISADVGCATLPPVWLEPVPVPGKAERAPEVKIKTCPRHLAGRNLAEAAKAGDFLVGP